MLYVEQLQLHQLFCRNQREERQDQQRYRDNESCKGDYRDQYSQPARGQFSENMIEHLNFAPWNVIHNILLYEFQDYVSSVKVKVKVVKCTATAQTAVSAVVVCSGGVQC